MMKIHSQSAKTSIQLDFFSLGLIMVKKYSTEVPSMNATNLRLFREHFGVSPIVMLVCWNLLLKHNDLPSIKPKHLLWACLFLKTYGKEDTHCAICDCDRKTFRSRVWNVVRAISNLEAHVVSRNSK